MFELIDNPYLRNIVGMLMIGVLIYALLSHRRPLLCRGRRLLHHSGDPHRRSRHCRRCCCCCSSPSSRATSVSLGSGASGGIFSPSLFMGATHRRRLRRFWSTAVHPVDGLRHHHLRHHRHGRHGRRRHRRRHDRRHHDFRDDPRLRPGDAEHHRGRARHRRPAPAVAGKHLHHQAGRPRPFRAEGAARQHVPGAPRRRSHGAATSRSSPADADFDAFLRQHAQRRRLQARGGDARQSHRRRRARQYQPAARRRAGL